MTFITRPTCTGLFNSPEMEQDKEFFPRGAIAFFVTLMLVYAGFWLFIASIMVSRG